MGRCSCFALVFAVLLFLSPGAAVAQDNQYGAIAYSPSTRAIGLSSDQPSREEAARVALALCGKSDCRFAAWFRNGCGALAIGEGGGWGTGVGTSQIYAERYALEVCSDYAMRCRIQHQVCVTSLGRNYAGGSGGTPE